MKWKLAPTCVVEHVDTYFIENGLLSMFCTCLLYVRYSKHFNIEANEFQSHRNGENLLPMERIEVEDTALCP